MIRQHQFDKVEILQMVLPERSGEAHEELTRHAAMLEEHGGKPEVWDQEQIRGEVASPTYLGAIYEAEGTAMVHPAKLAWGLAKAARTLGISRDNLRYRIKKFQIEKPE